MLLNMCPGGAPVMLALHAPDRLFSGSVVLVFSLVVAAVLAVALRRLTRQADHRVPALMGVTAAFIFAAQMVNFPIAMGITGHLLGGTLAAILLGPWAASVVMASVILFQALLGDGGLTALGPNIFNMGLVGTLIAWLVYRAAAGSAPSSARQVGAAFFAAWFAVVLASVFASVQLAVSGSVSLFRILPAMVGCHMAIGVGEAAITAAVLAFVLRTRPEVARAAAGPAGGQRSVVLGGLALSMVVALGLSLLPTLWDYPDGLEYVGIEKGLLIEEPEESPDGELLSLPAYPLGVRLKLVDGRPTAVHRYEVQGGALQVGDRIEAIEGRAVSDLASAAEALRLGEGEPPQGLIPGQSVTVTVRRGDRLLDLHLSAAAAPVAGSVAPLVALLPDYTFPGVDGLISTSLAGGLGTLIMFVLSFAVGRALVRPGRLEAAYLAQTAAGDGGD